MKPEYMDNNFELEFQKGLGVFGISSKCNASAEYSL